MLEPSTLPLATNYNETNIAGPRDSAASSFATFPYSEASIAKILTDFGKIGIKNENTLTDPLNIGTSFRDNLQGVDDVAALKAELEATRKKLAEYEAHSRTVPQTSIALQDQSPSRNPYSSNSPGRSIPRNEGIWSEPLSSIPNIPPPPRPSPLRFPYTVPPLRLPSATVPFQASSSDPSLTSSKREQDGGADLDASLSTRNVPRNFSLPIPPPIGEPRRILDTKRTISTDYKTSYDISTWKPSQDWQASWQNTSIGEPPRHLSGPPSLGVLYDEQLPMWNENFAESPASQRFPPAEQVDWRRLLDRTMSCNWNSVIEKVICQCDQQASLFLQQKLKLATVTQRHEIVDTIVRHCHPLMVNRFGNFLVQRCFEYGTKEQIDAIANAIRGNVVSLSMDMFGCHVVQKAFDCVDEDYKAAMVKELLCRIPETVNHRFSCHVWQKLLEIRWMGAPPVIMKYVNDALRGMWTEIALGETGSLVVQNVFENCLEEDKRPCIEEILANVDTIARGQWGNWVIQHIVEHGHPEDRARALDVILKHAAIYSMDQFASKVIEKALKCCGPDIFQSYVTKIVEKEPGRPRVALIDISSDIYGNYLIQYILQNGSPSVCEQISIHIRKHMVSLRGSRYGQRVAFQVERMRTAQKSTSTSAWQHPRWE